MSALPLKADMLGVGMNVRFVPTTDRWLYQETRTPPLPSGVSLQPERIRPLPFAGPVRFV